MRSKQFGGKLSKSLIVEYSQSPNWRAGRFQNLETTEAVPGFFKIPQIIYKQLTNRKKKEPDTALPVAPFSVDAFLAADEKPKFIWYGHSVVLLRMNGKTLLIDPMLGPDCTPIAPFPTKRFSENTLQFIDDFPEIDLLLLTHDHYDHLDYASIQKLKAKTKKYFVAKGVKRHLLSWGVDDARITEFDWWDKRSFEGIQITFTPTRHFSGRGLQDRFKSLWGGWAFQTKAANVWFSGDGGYGKHFKEIGNQLGPFDFAFMECGQYCEDWALLHLFPDESVRAAMDAKVNKAMPVHWAGFALSYQHDWYEPAVQFVEAAIHQSLAYTLPELGKVTDLSSAETAYWWDTYIKP